MIARTTSETGEKNTSSSPSDLLLAKFFRKITSPSHISCKQINSNNIEPTNTPAENGKNFMLHQPGIEPRANAWKAFMLPLHHWCPADVLMVGKMGYKICHFTMLQDI